jgi:hypothetical protein
MKQSKETIIISGTKETIEAIQKQIEQQPQSNSRLSQSSNLDGDVAAWVVIATLSAQVLPAILSFIKDMVSIKSIKKIKIGDVEIENPTPEMVDKLLKKRNVPVNGKNKKRKR